MGIDEKKHLPLKDNKEKHIDQICARCEHSDSAGKPVLIKPCVDCCFGSWMSGFRERR